MSTVTFSAGWTRNMGDYESLRIDLGVSDDPRGEETTEQAYNRIKDFVESRLMTEVDAVESAIATARKEIRARQLSPKKVAVAAEADEEKDK